MPEPWSSGLEVTDDTALPVGCKAPHPRHSSIGATTIVVLGQASGEAACAGQMLRPGVPLEPHTGKCNIPPTGHSRLHIDFQLRRKKAATSAQ